MLPFLPDAFRAVTRIKHGAKGGFGGESSCPEAENFSPKSRKCAHVAEFVQPKYGLIVYSPGGKRGAEAPSSPKALKGPSAVSAGRQSVAPTGTRGQACIFVMFRSECHGTIPAGMAGYARRRMQTRLVRCWVESEKLGAILLSRNARADMREKASKISL